MLQLLVGPIASLIGKVIDKAVPDKAEAARLKAETLANLHQLEATELQGTIDIIKAEAQGGSWLQRSWRPITMLGFLFLVLYSAIGPSMFGLPPVDMSGVPDRAWGVLMTGLGGYVVGRSGEKMIKTWKEK